MNANPLYIKSFNISLFMEKWFKIDILLFETINQILLYLEIIFCNMGTNESLIKFVGTILNKSFLNYAICESSPTTMQSNQRSKLLIPKDQGNTICSSDSICPLSFYFNEAVIIFFGSEFPWKIFVP